jgi:hypothetical protein
MSVLLKNMEMGENKKVDIGELIRKGTPVTEAIRRGSMKAMKRHIQAGAPWWAIGTAKWPLSRQRN